MLYQIGPLTLDTRPFSADAMSRSGGADLAIKPIMGSLPGREFMGEGDDKVTLSGQLLPSKIGGLTELEMAWSLSRTGTQVPLVRGDGRMLGWYAIEGVSEQHSDLMRDGVGFVIKYSLSLVKTGGEQAIGAGGAGVIGMLLSLFEGL